MVLSITNHFKINKHLINIIKSPENPFQSDSQDYNVLSAHTFNKVKIHFFGIWIYSKGINT